MSLAPLLVKSLVRLLESLVRRPAASVTTILYYGRALPRNQRLRRLVHEELLDEENYMFHFLINVLKCFC